MRTMSTAYRKKALRALTDHPVNLINHKEE